MGCQACCGLPLRAGGSERSGPTPSWTRCSARRMGDDTESSEVRPKASPVSVRGSGEKSREFRPYSAKDLHLFCEDPRE